MSLVKYKKKRDFKKTPEPEGKVLRNRKEPIFVIQKHHARRLHYDFRLESGGTLKSWAVPKGPSLNPNDKRLAVEVEDHPIDYANFEGDIPKGEYGAGHVIVWDKGTWVPQGNVSEALRKGHLDFELRGEKLSGKWSLIRTRGLHGTARSWLLIKKADQAARTTGSVTERRPESVLAKKTKAIKEKPLKKKSLRSPPAFVQPQLAQLVDEIPRGPEWIHELKLDGYRHLCRIENGRAQFLTRTGLDWSAKYASLVKSAEALPVDNALIDGEIVWLDEKGRSDFQQLQNTLSEKKHNHLVYCVFDLLFLNGEDIRDVALIKRKEVLQKLIESANDEKIVYSQHVDHSAQKLFQQVCREELEGLVSKDGTQPYHSGRNGVWQKTKCSLRQEFVIGGFTPSPAADRSFGAILTGVFEGKKLRYTGKVGTGFTKDSLNELKEKFVRLSRKTSPFVDDVPEKNVHWLKPELVAEIDFKAWTSDGLVRQGSFKGLREDKKSQVVVEETKVKADSIRNSKRKIKARSDAPSLEESVKITHPNRIVYPKSKTKKIDVVQYYEKVFPFMEPFLRDRPLSLLRCPEASGKDCFFQKHNGRQLDVRTAPVYFKDKKDTALMAETRPELVSLAQGGTLEIHGWGARFSHITKPDLIVFDLDPESPKLWKQVVKTALEIKDMLERLGLTSFVKVTGGKGLHIHVPLRPENDWDVVKGFSKSFMQVLENQEPDMFTTNPLKSERRGRIFLDYLRNGYGATAVLPYSLRAKDQPTVAWPIKWSEVKVGLDPSGFTLTDVLKKLKNYKSPWTGYWDVSQTLPGVGKKKSKKASELHEVV